MYCALITLQYAYSILSIISGFIVLTVTFFITILTSFFSLSRLHFDKIPISTFWMSLILNPALWSYRAALMVDHDNTNPIKFMVLEWFKDRLQASRKAEVGKLGSCICICERCLHWEFFALLLLRILFFSNSFSNATLSFSLWYCLPVAVFDERFTGVAFSFCTKVIWR